MGGKLSERREAQTVIAVLAGNYAQFRDWLRSQDVYGELFSPTDKRPHRAFFARDRSLRGRMIDGILVVGSFWDRKDAVELHAFAQHGLKVPASS